MHIRDTNTTTNRINCDGASCLRKGATTGSATFARWRSFFPLAFHPERLLFHQERHPAEKAEPPGNAKCAPAQHQLMQTNEKGFQYPITP